MCQIFCLLKALMSVWGNPLGLFVMQKTSLYYELIDVLGNTAW